MPMSHQNSRLVEQLADAPRCFEMRLGCQPLAIVFRYLRGLHGYSRAGVSRADTSTLANRLLANAYRMIAKPLTGYSSLP